MVNRIGGLASGMDIDALVEKLMAAEKSPLIKLQQKKQTTLWTRDAYRSVNTKLETFRQNIYDNLLLKSFNTKTATTSNSNYLTATATSKASGTLTIEGVSQLATAARATGTQKNATKDSKLEELGITSSSISFKAIQSNGKLAENATKIEFDPMTTTVSQLVEKINNSNAGVTAVFENGRFSITAKNTGDVKGGAEIVVANEDTDTLDKLGLGTSTDLASNGQNAMFQVNGIATERSTNSFEISGYKVTLKSTFNATNTINESLKAAYAERKNAKESLPLLQSTAANKETAYNNKLNNFNSTFDSTFLTGLSNGEKTSYTTLNNAGFLNGLTTEEIDELATLDLSTLNLEDANNGVTESLNEKLKSLKPEQLAALDNLDKTQLQSLQSVASKEVAYINADTKFLANLTDEDIGIISTIDWSADKPLEGLADSETKNKLSKLNNTQLQALKGLNKDELVAYKGVASSQLELQTAEAEKISAADALKAGEQRVTDALATVNAARAAAGYPAIDDTEDPNSAPPQITGSGTTEPSVTITSTTDVDDIMKKIKEFVTTYNGLIKDLNDQTKETKYRDYAPLTDEQRKEMSENEIKLWEEKAKSGLLRSDTIIRGGISNMRSLIYESYPGVENKKYNTLFSIGITTSKSYNDGGTLEIDDEKLRKALEEDPDAVTALFANNGNKEEKKIIDGVEQTVDTRGFLVKLRESMNNFKLDIEKKAGRATLTDNQYSIGKNIIDMDKRIDTWKDKLEKIEARYWKQFSAMEKAINKANSQSSYFAQFSGQA
ncbi:flagellar filament capping protein FliD [Lysinibacillus irui]|uniref:flagellar filament capping protein FliD n=1 Tax=Lysinibacillus irui TaxID=2998077 RepID=UPI0038874310